MDAATRALVWERAQSCCEYCHMPYDVSAQTQFHVEHIYAKKHGGSDDLQNLCLSCAHCNWAKGTDLSGLLEGKIIPLFHPRRQTWTRHFYWDGPVAVARTMCGKVTISVSSINDADRILMRQSLIDEGQFPPEDL